MNNKKILFISETYPSGLTGTSVKTRSTVEFLLSNGFSVDVACIRFKTLSVRELKHPNLRIFSVYREGIRKLRLGLINRVFSLLFSRKPVRVNRIYDQRLDSVVQTLIYSFNYDYILFDGFSTLQYCQSVDGRNVYIDDEDITILVKQRMEESRNVFKKVFLFAEYQRCLFFEKKQLAQMGQIWGISTGSLNRIKMLSNARSFLMPTLVSEQKNVFNPYAKHVVFTGTLSWSENKVGLEWFITHCWDKVVEKLPETKLFVIGQQGDDSWKILASKHKNIELLGFVDELADIYSQSGVAISPIFINVGIKVKVLTYLSYGLPVVGTKLSLGGMSSQKGVVVSREDEFAETIVRVLEHDKLRLKLSKEGRENIKKHHSKDALNVFFIKTGVIDHGEK